MFLRLLKSSLVGNKGNYAMSDTTHLSEARRALLHKFLQGNLSHAATVVDAIPRRAPDAALPLSFAQQPFWLFSQLNLQQPVYNQGVHLHLTGPLDVAALAQSLQEIIQRHEAWRTSFPVENGQPIQRVHPSFALALPIVDAQPLPLAEREAAALQHGTALVNQPFDLTQAPPLRALLVRLGQEDHHLFLALHHSITDGLSAHQILLQELQTLYQAFSAGQPSPLPVLALQYGDYAAWQRETLQGEALEKHLAYWKDRLAGVPEELALPLDHPRPASPSGQGAVHPFTLPKSLSAALHTLSQQEGVTLFTTLLAAFATLLHRYSGQDDLVIGTPASGRARPELQQLLGVFVNTLPLRADLSGNPTFRELLKRAQAVVLGALAHEDLPFEQLVRHLRPERSLAQNPFVQVLLSLQPPTTSLPPGWANKPMALANDLDRFDLSLDLEEDTGGLIGFLKYNPDLFAAPTIERMAGHWQTLLEGIVAQPDQPIATLPLLTSAERHQVLVEWNDTEVAYPAEPRLHCLFEAQVERSPQAIAVRFEQATLTYQELNQRANQLAHHLQRLGVGPDVLVGVCLERSLDLVVALFAILKAGGAYVPLDPDYPQERLAFMLADARVPVLLTHSALRDHLPTGQAQVLCLDSDWPRIAQEDASNPASDVQPEHLAYVIYTSGSTGKPKGAMNTHQGICNRLLWMQDAYQLTARDRVLQKTPFSFDVSVWEFFWPLIVGAELVVARPGGHRDTAYLDDVLTAQQITTVHFVPSMLQLFLQGARHQTYPHLRRVICSGEALSVELQDRFFARFQAELHNLYGPTEAAVDVTFWACQRGAGQRTVPIGRPIANTQIYLLDQHLQPVPIGVPGELHIGGVGLARGYLNRPELTNEKFIPDPFQPQPGHRLYKTGDLARYLPDGAIEYLGRIDHQVKLRGFRIELGEVEAILAQHPAVEQAVVVAQEDASGDKRLIAYLVPTSEQATATTLRSYLKERLPEYMVPAVFITLNTIPLTPSGKVNRRALPAPAATAIQRDEEMVAPRTPTEQQLAAIWTDLLGVPQVGVNDNFFALGGHSLLALRVLLRIQEEFQIELPLSAIFETPTIAGLALKIVQSQAQRVDDVTLAQLLSELE
jgi:amino acid adenylation domain-containing protein